MGNSKSKKVQKEPDRFFERERWKEDQHVEARKKPSNSKKRIATVAKESPMVVDAPPPVPRPAPTPSRPYDDEALERMRQQLLNDSDAFLLNNILLSVQFFKNYEKELHHLKGNPVTARDTEINNGVLRHHKHVFFADKLHELVHEHVRYRRPRGSTDALSPLRLFVVYDNVEASEPGENSHYSAVLDAPFYKMIIEDCKEPGYIRLRKLEVLESSLYKEMVIPNTSPKNSGNEISDYTDSEKESNSSEERPNTRSQGEALLQKIKSRLEENTHVDVKPIVVPAKLSENTTNQLFEGAGRRRSGPIKHVSSVAAKANISNLAQIRKGNLALSEEVNNSSLSISRDSNGINNSSKPVSQKYNNEPEAKPRKSILKSYNNRRPSGPIKETRAKTTYSAQRKLANENSIAEDTETSGYRSNSSPQNESSGTESDYGYSTITEMTTPKPVELSIRNDLANSGVLPENCWTPIQVKSTGQWSDEEDDEEDKIEVESKETGFKSLYETMYYLNSISFMSNFVDNLMLKLGSALGFSTDAVSKALTQGASIYIDGTNNTQAGREIIPAVIAAWPNTANGWIIRERRIIQNPRTNFSYQWPTKYMVNKAMGFGCVFVPVGYRPKRGSNPDQKLQWRIIFPAAERYLESCLAHSHVRCYMFTLTLVKSFMENDTFKVGIDASHIKNHLFWQCEDNYAMWPEDRLGETLRIFLRTFYRHLGQARFPNYFMENCNDFKSIPKTILLKQQRQLANILESPVMHLLNAIQNLKYAKRDFYPVFDCMQLYRILTTKNVLHLLNPNLAPSNTDDYSSSDSDDPYKEETLNFWDKAKARDKSYQWRKERQRQEKEKRKATVFAKKQKKEVNKEIFIDKNIVLPSKMEPERRRLVLEFFIPHFIIMAQHSDKFEATKQAVIFLEQAQRLSILLQEEPSGEFSANDFLTVIKRHLGEYKRKLLAQAALKVPKRKESVRLHDYNRTRPNQNPRLKANYENVPSQDFTPPPSPGIAPFMFDDIHEDEPSTSKGLSFRLGKSIDSNSDEDSKL